MFSPHRTIRALIAALALLTVTTYARADSPPSAGNDNYALMSGNLSVTAPGVLANDTDADGDPLTATLVSEPAQGTVTLNADGSFTYIPDVDFSGSDSFTYTANDGTSDSNVATVTINGDAPDALDDFVKPWFDVFGYTAYVRALVNDTDPNGDPLKIISVTQPVSGFGYVQLLPNNSIYYNYYGDSFGLGHPFTGDSFTYTISDGHGGEDTATIFITTQNNAPVALDDFSDATNRTSISIDVQVNDYDEDMDTDGYYRKFTITDATQGAHGTVEVIDRQRDDFFKNQEIVYTPGPDFTGTDQFTYTITDLSGEQSTATVFIEPKNHAPVTRDDPDPRIYSTQQEVYLDTPRTLTPVANDRDPDDDPLTLTGFTQPAHGTIEVVFGSYLRYTPEAGYIGPDEFTYTISDGRGGEDTGTMYLLVVNPYPEITTISPDSVVAGGPTFTLTVNGVDKTEYESARRFMPSSRVEVNGTQLETTYVSPTQLTAVVPASLIAAPGRASVQVITPITDSYYNLWGSNTVYLTITETPPNRPPDARDDVLRTIRGIGADIYVLGNDTDPDLDTLTLTAVTPGPDTHGTLTFNPNGTVHYTPDAGFTGEATFTYSISDGNGGEDTATVTVTVNNPTPRLLRLSPDTAMLGGPAFTLTVSGTGFIEGSTLRWNGASRPTTYVSPTQITAEIPASDIASPGAASITVANPAPGGGVSNPLVLVMGTPKLGITVTLARSGSEAVATITLRNTGGATAANVRLNTATLQRGAAPFPGASLPLFFGDIAPGGAVTQTVSFNVGATPGGSASLILSGTYTGGTFGGTTRTTLP